MAMSLGSSATASDASSASNTRGMAILSVHGARHSYGGVQALKGVDFQLLAGEIHGL